MAKKQPEPVQIMPRGSVHENIYKLLHEERELNERLDTINKEKTEIAMMLCTEANMTEASKKKNIKFGIEGKEGTVVVRRMDRMKIDDPDIELKLSAAKAEYEAKIKSFKDEYNTTKKMVEVQAMNSNKAHKQPSYYANFEGAGKEYQQQAEDE